MADTKKYKLALVLSGGGARGFAHLGALQALNEKGIYPDIIVGTSAGALAGALYADGYTPLEIIGLFKKMKFTEFTEFTLPKEGFFKSTRFRAFMRKHLRAKQFEELKMPLWAVASDIEYGESHVFSKGDLISAVVASCSIPIVFTPVEIDGHHYVDGGLFANFPVSMIRRKCEKLIGVNVSPMNHTEYTRSLKYIIERTFYSLTTSNSIIDRELCDVLIESCEIAEYSMYDLEHAETIYQKGYEMAMNALNNMNS
ncbi:patatin-like phospholipase family protein [Bacteroides sp. 224]|uniref:patatin-like phospholipase family protein n=1 Tax=Bacteroides sp. 224 TaxID=2302936 RepID=UPI0013D614EC|nr:phospholipase [Bacteroides sp. 224]